MFKSLYFSNLKVLKFYWVSMRKTKSKISKKRELAVIIT